MSERRRIVILRNPAKPEAEATLASLVAAIHARAVVVATGTIDQAETLVRERPDRIVVLGGDGSILAVARSLGMQQIPIVGVNFGKLGYLAEFSLEDVSRHLDAILDDDGIVSRRIMLDASITRDRGQAARAGAVNDCVIHAGPPYRMIELALEVDGNHLTKMSGDGLVLATPCGSTAHNMAVGGPILESEIPAIVVTPISPHSLTHRPLVVAGNSTITVRALQANQGTTAVVDGQVSLPLHAGDCLTVRRYDQDFQLVHNPSQPPWYTLIKKLKWGQ